MDYFSYWSRDYNDWPYYVTTKNNFWLTVDEKLGAPTSNYDLEEAILEHVAKIDPELRKNIEGDSESSQLYIYTKTNEDAQKLCGICDEMVKTYLEKVNEIRF